MNKDRREIYPKEKEVYKYIYKETETEKELGRILERQNEKADSLPHATRVKEKLRWHQNMKAKKIEMQALGS